MVILNPDIIGTINRNELKYLGEGIPEAKILPTPRCIPPVHIGVSMTKTFSDTLRALQTVE